MGVSVGSGWALCQQQMVMRCELLVKKDFVACGAVVW